MKDSEVRGLILKSLYDQRHTKHFVDMPEEIGIDLDKKVLGNVAIQLEQQGLISFKQYMGKPYPSGLAKILAYGVDVVEGTTTPPITITVDSSVNVHGSNNIQIGGQGNVQTVTMEVDKIVSIIDSSGASVVEKEEAKSLLKKLSENSLVRSALGAWFKSKLGG
jgi:hypothetical protein